MMSLKARILLVGLVAAGLMACGEDVSEINCAEGTEYDEEADECLLEQPDCEDDEQFVEDFNECARISEDYCSEGTDYDADEGVCVADTDLECGDETVDEDGHCIPDQQLSCGEGTVLYDNQCMPDDKVCGPGTDTDSDLEVVDCRPTAEVCGQGTEYDELTHECVPQSTLECGPGTVAVETECLPATSYYEGLAENPDLDADETDGTGQLEVPDEGESFVFVGTIDEPEIVDGDPVQDQDYFELDAQAGQWLELTVYSLGLPEPGFEFDELDPADADEGFVRHSDLGSGLRAHRQMAIPADGDYELMVGNMPQMRDVSPPAGGDDWKYVGVVEKMERPASQPVDIFEQTIGGDVRQLATNLYAFDGMDDVGSIQMLFDEVPEDTDAEFQLWTDDETRVETIALDDDEIPFEPPADSFELLFDHVGAEGFSTDFSVTGRQARPIAEGETAEYDLDFEAGDYVAVSQYNTDGETISATVVDDDGEAIAETDELTMWNDDTPARFLYAYSQSAQSATIQLHNETGSDLESVAIRTQQRGADEMTITDGDLQQLDVTPGFEAGQRHYIELDVDFDRLLGLSLDGDPASNLMTLYDQDGEQIIRDADALSFPAEPGDYLLVVDTLEAMASGFTVNAEEADQFMVRESSEPSATIPTGQIALIETIDVEYCPVISDIEVAVEIVHTYRGDLVVDIEAPNEDTARIHDESGGLSNDIIGTYPYPDDPGLEDGEELLDFVGLEGHGEWTITIVDQWADAVSNGDLESWSIQLTCET